MRGTKRTVSIQDPDGYLYCKHRELLNDKTTWRCSKRRTLGCRSSIKTSQGFIVERLQEHNHLSQRVEVEENVNGELVEVLYQ